MPTRTGVGDTTVFPSVCPHCKSSVTNPPSWIRVLEMAAPGKGNSKEGFFTKSHVAKALKVSRERSRQLVESALKSGAVEAVVQGGQVFRKTTTGSQIIARWKRAGWTGKRVPTQEDSR